MPPSTPKTRQPSALVVEDDRALREFYRTSLRAAGYDVGSVEDGTDALHRIEEWIPDVIVLDLVLPRLSGRDLYQELRTRRDTRDVPIVVVSGTDTSDLDVTRFAAILRKPVDSEALVRAVDTAVRRRS